MADDLIVGPFGRLLPRPSQLVSRSNSSETQNHHPTFGTDTMFPTRMDPSNASQMNGAPSQGYQLPPFNQILNHQDTASQLNRPSPAAESSSALQMLQRETSGSANLQPYGGIDPVQDRWRSFGQGSDNGDGSYQPISQVSESSYLPRVNAFQMPQPPRSPITLPSLTSQHSSSSHSSSFATSTHPQGRRVLREEVIPGRGVCYIYEDGAICPKAVDGDSVNPQWGITKAGKPRKRLAQACTTCREKKIKCDPGTPKCIQCQKFGRQCLFEPFSRSNPRSPDSQSVSQSPTMSNTASPLPAHRDSLTSNDQSNHTSSRPISSSKSSMTLGSILSPEWQENTVMDDETPDQSSKRRRCSASEPDMSVEASLRTSTFKRKISESPVLGVAGKTLSWDSDPYEVDPKLTEHYLNEYFRNVNTTTYCMFPRSPFMKWVRDNSDKSHWERMLIYAMLASGSIFAINSQQKIHGKVFSKIAHQAVSQSTGVFNLQVVQTKLILALYNFALDSSAAKAWDLCGGAIRAACAMRLNLESGLEDVKDDQVMDYDFPRATLIECRRRTFWSAYVMDRFCSYCAGNVSMIHNADCLLRLPCDERKYEEGNIPETPFFQSAPSTSERKVHQHSGIGMMGYLVQAASIWGDVLGRVYRSRYRSPDGVEEAYEDFYRRTTKQLRGWEDRLPLHLRLTSENIARADREGCLGAYETLHTLHYCTIMKLNRHTRQTDVSLDNTVRNIRAAHHYAEKTLELMQQLANRQRGNGTSQSGFAAWSPFTGFAILTAIDILTAMGTLADMYETQSRTMSLVAGSIQALEELSTHWRSAKRQAKLVAGRYGDLILTVKSISSAKKVAFFSPSPMETTFGRDLDLVYKIPRRHYLDALGIGVTVVSDDELLEIRRGSRSGIDSSEGGSIWDNDLT